LSKLPLNTKVVWRPNKGVQEIFLSCPIQEILLDGNRGWGKTELIIMKFLKYVGTNKKPKYGAYWKGVILRTERKPLEECITKGHLLIKKIFPTAVWKGGEGNQKWVFENGEELLFRFGKDKRDYEDKFHGNQFPYIAFDELTSWATDEFYMSMITCNRAVNPEHPEMPKFFISTTNPFGLGHRWIKKRFYDADPIGGRVIIDIVKDAEGNDIELKRTRLQGTMLENLPLLASNPEYYAKIKSEKLKSKRMAWLYGDWEIEAGGYFEESWDRSANVIEPFEIPKSWYIDRSFDYGRDKPFAVCWYAESDGTPYYVNQKPKRTVKGDTFLIYELYGCVKGEPNKGLKWSLRQVSEAVLKIDAKISARFNMDVNDGVADSGINQVTDSVSIRDKMAECGLTWKKTVNKDRVTGWAIMADMMFEARNPLRENPAFFVWSNNVHFLETVPMLMCDEVAMDDIDTKQEDHIADAVRYRLATKRYGYSTGNRLQ